MTSDFTPHYDTAGQFIGVTLHATKYAPGHPIADLWLKYDSAFKVLEAVAMRIPDDASLFAFEEIKKLRSRTQAMTIASHIVDRKTM